MIGVVFCCFYFMYITCYSLFIGSNLGGVLPEKKVMRNLQAKIEPDGSLSKKIDAAAAVLGMNTSDFVLFAVNRTLDQMSTNIDDFIADLRRVHEEQIRKIEQNAREALVILQRESGLDLTDDESELTEDSEQGSRPGLYEGLGLVDQARTRRSQSRDLCGNS